MFWKISIAILLACLVALSAAGVAVLLETRRLLRDVRADEAKFSAKGLAVMDVVKQAAEHARDASDQARGAAVEQRKNLQAELREIKKATADVHDLLIHTDLNVNGTHNHPESGVLPRLALLLSDTDVLARQTAAGVQQAMNGLQPSLDNMARASAAAAEQMGNPKIRETIAHADEVSANVAAATQSLAGVSANAKTASDLALERLRQMLKPVSFARALLEKLLGVTAQGAQIYSATH